MPQDNMSEDQIAVAIDAVWSRRRKVHKQRARKLRRRGEFVWWDVRAAKPRLDQGCRMSDLSADQRLPRVVHLKREPYDVRIDRQTHWGNPFVIGKDGTRSEVIRKYREWILGAGNEHMVELAKKELRSKVLGCWCAPLACHGNVLLEIANG